MKKIYIPTEDELYQMQSLSDGSFIYKYILCKAIEVLVMEGKLNPDKGILERAYKWLRENPQIAIGICRMYPNEIPNSDYAQNDIKLCESIARGELIPDSTICCLDNLTYFEEGIGVLSNDCVSEAAIETLATKLPRNPRYRFEYKEPNSLLDSIFLCDLPSRGFSSKTASELVSLEPAHILRLDPKVLIGSKKERIVHSVSDMFIERINKYSNRYGMERETFSEYFGEDIITKPDDNVKRLLKYLERHKRKYK